MKFKNLEEVERYFTMFGFKKYKDNLNNADFSMQKCIYDNTTGEKKYFIEIYVYDLRKFRNDWDIYVSYEAGCQFYLEGDSTVNIKLFGRNHLNDEIHKFFEKFYNDFKCIPYERS